MKKNSNKATMQLNTVELSYNLTKTEYYVCCVVLTERYNNAAAVVNN